MWPRNRHVFPSRDSISRPLLESYFVPGLTHVASAVPVPAGDADVVVCDHRQLPNTHVIGDRLALDLAENVGDAVSVVARLAPTGGGSLEEEDSYNPN